MLDLKSAVTELLVRNPCRACSEDALLILHIYFINVFGIGHHWAHYNINISVPKSKVYILTLFFDLHFSGNHKPNDENHLLDWIEMEKNGNESQPWTLKVIHQ